MEKDKEWQILDEVLLEITVAVFPHVGSVAHWT